MIFFLLFVYSFFNYIFAGDFVDIPKNEIGPCTLLNNRMKCTGYGYFELIQCDKASCYCVQANNGEIAFETKTPNSRMAPTCSVCYNRLKQLYSNGQPAKNVWIPLCDNRKGDFQNIQCTSNRENCFCVDKETGNEIPGTRTDGSNGLRCEQMNDEATQREPTKGLNVIPLGSPSCRFGKDRGYRCAETTPIVQWHFDVETFQCLAFEYLGCGGNQNRFPNEKECSTTCKFADLSGCAGMKSPSKDTQGKTITCGQTLMNAPHLFPPPPPQIGNFPQFSRNPDDECPKEDKCVIGAFIGVCCDRGNEELFQRNFWPTCQFGKPFQWNDHQVLIGKSCSDNFCPRETSCEQGYFFAYCCSFSS
ncbi:unnamed protein product, partial [Mesorhabditis belari]|uniref:Uncharacterized protein n=1 Tax=Mesorhabditis belari TaxID=2138241 RepID=A0AAF3EFY6_9BILA